MQCANLPTSHREVQVRGPGGVVAVLKVSSTDDSAKDSHQCFAAYQLDVFPAPSAVPAVMARSYMPGNLMSSDGEWGRRLSIRLDGFSLDGRTVFGSWSEGDGGDDWTLFAYRAANGKVELVNIPKALLKQIVALKCGSTVAVAGTTDVGAIVLKPGSEKPCGATNRWLLDPVTGKVQPLARGGSVLGLYKDKSNAR